MFIGDNCLKTLSLILGQFISDHPVYFFQTLRVSNIKIMFIIDWPHPKILWHGEDNSAGISERGKKERKTEEEIGR